MIIVQCYETGVMVSQDGQPVQDVLVVDWLGIENERYSTAELRELVAALQPVAPDLAEAVAEWLPERDA